MQRLLKNRQKDNTETVFLLSQQLHYQLKNNDIEVIFICGVEDKDCFPQCKLLEKKTSDMGLDINSIYIEKLGHEYPVKFNEIVKSFI